LFTPLMVSACRIIASSKSGQFSGMRWFMADCRSPDVDVQDHSGWDLRMISKAARKDWGS
jgi:hypothetical protein